MCNDPPLSLSHKHRHLRCVEHKGVSVYVLLTKPAVGSLSLMDFICVVKGDGISDSF